MFEIWNCVFSYSRGRFEDTRWLVISSTRRRIILCTNAPNVFQPNPFRLFSQNPFWHGGEIWLANPTQIRPVHSLHIELPSLCDQKNHKPPPTASVHPPFALIRKYHWHCRHNLRKSESYWTGKNIEKKIGNKKGKELSTPALLERKVISKYGWPKQSVGRERSKWKKIHFECFYKIDFGTRTCAVNPLWYTDFTLSRFVLGSAPLTAPVVSFCSGPAPPIHPPAGPITPLLIAPSLLKQELQNVFWGENRPNFEN